MDGLQMMGICNKTGERDSSREKGQKRAVQGA